MVVIAKKRRKAKAKKGRNLTENFVDLLEERSTITTTSVKTLNRYGKIRKKSSNNPQDSFGGGSVETVC